MDINYMTHFAQHFFPTIILFHPSLTHSHFAWFFYLLVLQRFKIFIESHIDQVTVQTFWNMYVLFLSDFHLWYWIGLYCFKETEFSSVPKNWWITCVCMIFVFTDLILMLILQAEICIGCIVKHLLFWASEWRLKKNQTLNMYSLKDVLS